MKPGLTLSAGVRYDIEVFPYQTPGRSAIPAAHGIPDRQSNIAPRLGLVWNPDGESKSVVRAGYGMFYDRTLLGTVDNFLTDYKYRQSFTANFPAVGRRPRPAQRDGSRPIRCCRSRRRQPAHARHSGLHPELGVSAGIDRAQHRHGQWDDPEPAATVLPSVQRGLRARGLHRRLGIGRLRPHVRP